MVHIHRDIYHALMKGKNILAKLVIVGKILETFLYLYQSFLTNLKTFVFLKLL